MPGPAESAAAALGLDFRVLRHGPVSSVAEAAAAQGVEVRDLVKTLVVRRADDDYVFVLVPGDRQISWPKLRALLGVNRLSMPSAATALAKAPLATAIEPHSRASGPSAASAARR